MSRADQLHTLEAIEAQGALERQALSKSLAEISGRLQPRHLVDEGVRFAKQRAGQILGAVSDSVKANGGSAALVGLGAVLAFDVGRRSAGVASGKAATHDWYQPDSDVGILEDNSLQLHRKATNSARMNAIANWSGGVLLGHIIGRSIGSTLTEEELFAESSVAVRQATKEFIDQHSHGAKLAAAEAFGFAKYTAAFLAIMAVVSDRMIGRSERADPPAGPGPT